MPSHAYCLLVAPTEVELDALKGLPQYAGWTFFEPSLAFSDLESNGDGYWQLPDQVRVSVGGPGYFTVGFKP